MRLSVRPITASTTSGTTRATSTSPEHERRALVELDNRVIKTSPYESDTGNPAPRPTSSLKRILVGRGDDDDKTTISASLVSRFDCWLR